MSAKFWEFFYPLTPPCPHFTQPISTVHPQNCKFPKLQLPSLPLCADVICTCPLGERRRWEKTQNKRATEREEKQWTDRSSKRQNESHREEGQREQLKSVLSKLKKATNPRKINSISFLGEKLNGPALYRLCRNRNASLRSGQSFYPNPNESDVNYNKKEDLFPSIPFVRFRHAFLLLPRSSLNEIRGSHSLLRLLFLEATSVSSAVAVAFGIRRKSARLLRFN